MSEVLFTVGNYEVTTKRAAGIAIIFFGLILIVLLGMGYI